MAIQTIQGVVAVVGVMAGLGVICTCWAEARLGAAINSRLHTAVAAAVSVSLDRGELTTRGILSVGPCPADASHSDLRGSGTVGERWDLGVAGASLAHAARHDLPSVFEILEDAARWVQSIGMETWPPGSFLTEGSKERGQLMRAFDERVLYVATVDAEPAGTLSLFDRDERFWPGAPRDALYVHKLAVRRRFGGRGLGVALIRWADDQARDRGKRFLRLDTSPVDPGILAYYRRLGFERRDDAWDGDLHVARLERPT
jgi:GNAT superfamily N-acetyltransferase